MVRARPRVSAWLWCGPRRGRAEKPGQASSRGDRSRNELQAGPSARNNGWVGRQHEASAWAAPMSSPGGTLASGETPSPPKAPRHQPRSEGRPDTQTEQSSAVPSATFRRQTVSLVRGVVGLSRGLFDRCLEPAVVCLLEKSLQELCNEAAGRRGFEGSGCGQAECISHCVTIKPPLRRSRFLRLTTRSSSTPFSMSHIARCPSRGHLPTSDRSGSVRRRGRSAEC
jgi:hypothetical protein